MNQKLPRTLQKIKKNVCFALRNICNIFLKFVIYDEPKNKFRIVIMSFVHARKLKIEPFEISSI